jgi:hypothetical protein
LLLVPLMFPAGLIGVAVGDPNAHGKTLSLVVDVPKSNAPGQEVGEEQKPYILPFNSYAKLTVSWAPYCAFQLSLKTLASALSFHQGEVLYLGSCCAVSQDCLLGP